MGEVTTTGSRKGSKKNYQGTRGTEGPAIENGAQAGRENKNSKKIGPGSKSEEDDSEKNNHPWRRGKFH